MSYNPYDPFTPEWYPLAFDSYIDTPDMQSNTDTVIASGYRVPDVDGSRSSIEYQRAILNNSFDEQILRETLNDVYINSSNRLVAANSDNVNFFQWHGRMSDMTFTPSTKVCEFRIPWNIFITVPERDAFKRSQFYRKWIKVEDILNNWKLFKWHLMLFIDQKVYSEYELQITEQEVIIRFNYVDYWVRKDHSVSIYKMDTNYQKSVS